MKHVAAAAMLAFLATTTDARADDFTLKSTHTGRVDYVFIGNAMVNNTSEVDGVNCLLTSNTAVLEPGAISHSATLVSATLYVSGSLIDDGVDYPPNIEIFSPPSGTKADVDTDQPALQAAARHAAAVAVDFQPPKSAPVRVSADPSTSYVTVYYVSSSSEMGNVGFFTTPIDVTQTLRAGGGPLAGTYQVSGLVADVCRGEEAVCGVTTCSALSNVHTNGTASFGLLLVYEDPALPLHSVSIFEGQQDLFANVKSINLVNGSSVSNPASGSLAYYVQEGDLSICNVDATQPCGGSEFVAVQSGTHGPRVCLMDADNPPGNLFNGTINTAPGSPVLAGCTGSGSCTSNAGCCTGLHACGMAGIDIDRFDISAGLSPGATEIAVDIGTGSDRIALATLVLGVDVYAPILAVDSQFRAFSSGFALETSGEQVGSVLTYSLAISNTGNVAANAVQVTLEAPAGVQDFQLLQIPEDAQQEFHAQGGAQGTGNFNVTSFTVQPGKIAEIRFQLTGACSLLHQALIFQARIAADLVTPFVVQSPGLVGGGPGLGLCDQVDEAGPFALTSPVRHLRGGGCASADATFWPLGLLAVLGRRRWKRCVLMCLVIGGMAQAACGTRHKSATSPYPPQNLSSIQNLPGVACDTALMAQATDPNGSVFCIDRFEAAIDGGALGNDQQSPDDTQTGLDGSTRAAAYTALGVVPAHSLSWYQAKAACMNAGKRLCTVTEWEAACRGPNLLTYPYGNVSSDTLCNGFFQYDPSNPATTGSFKLCVSAAGVYDMSGNVEEWLDTAVPREINATPLNDRMVHGGGYASNSSALACVGVEYHAAPANGSPDRGFRCCK